MLKKIFGGSKNKDEEENTNKVAASKQHVYNLEMYFLVQVLNEVQIIFFVAHNTYSFQGK